MLGHPVVLKELARSSVLADTVLAMPTIAFDLGGVLLTDGSQTAWQALQAKFGIPAEKSSRLWYEELQLPVDRGEVGEDELWGALSELGSGATEAEIRAVFFELP